MTAQGVSRSTRENIPSLLQFPVLFSLAAPTLASAEVAGLYDALSQRYLWVFLVAITRPKLKIMAGLYY